MSYPVTVNLPDAVHGDAWPPSPDATGRLAIGPILIDGAQPAAPLQRLEMRFRRGLHKFRIDSDSTQLPDAPATITNATTWEATIGPIQNFLPIAGLWVWDIAYYSGDQTSPLTIHEGQLLVKDDV